jgi:hypothetical protein
MDMTLVNQALTDVACDVMNCWDDPGRAGNGTSIRRAIYKCCST